MPTLLIASLAAVLAAVVGVVAVGQASTTLMLVAAMVLVVLGLVTVMVTIGAQLADEDGTSRKNAGGEVAHHPERTDRRR